MSNTVIPDRTEHRLTNASSGAHIGNGSDNTTTRSQDQLYELLGAAARRTLGICRLPDGFKLSVIVPVYNENSTVSDVIQRIRDTKLPCEIIIVDDGSTDGTRETLEQLSSQPDLLIHFHERNQGKGAALKTGFLHARGDVVVVQDADKEYDPGELRYLLQPIVDDEADIVYGSRFSGSSKQIAPAWHLFVNKLISVLFSLTHGHMFSDVETCYKMIRRDYLQRVAPHLRESRFGVELEITAKLLKLGDARFCERPISYFRRTYAAGKKIGWRDGFRALWCILRY